MIKTIKRTGRGIVSNRPPCHSNQLLWSLYTTRLECYACQDRDRETNGLLLWRREMGLGVCEEGFAAGDKGVYVHITLFCLLLRPYFFFSRKDRVKRWKDETPSFFHPWTSSASGTFQNRIFLLPNGRIEFFFKWNLKKRETTEIIKGYIRNDFPCRKALSFWNQERELKINFLMERADVQFSFVFSFLSLVIISSFFCYPRHSKNCSHKDAD